MKTILKPFALVIACASLLFAPVCAKAQNPKFSVAPQLVYTSVASGSSNYITLGNPAFIDCSKQRNVTVSFLSIGSTTSTGNVGFTFTPTVDGTTNTMMTNWSTTLVQALNGTTPVYWGTNLDSLGSRGFLITAYTNTAGSVLVTNTLTYPNKISTP